MLHRQKSEEHSIRGHHWTHSWQLPKLRQEPTALTSKQHTECHYTWLSTHDMISVQYSFHSAQMRLLGHRVASNIIKVNLRKHGKETHHPTNKQQTTTTTTNNDNNNKHQQQHTATAANILPVFYWILAVSIPVCVTNPQTHQEIHPLHSRYFFWKQKMLLLVSSPC